jgi:hypothetical protein
MAITYSATQVHAYNGHFTLEDLANNPNNNGIVQKLGNAYRINGNLIIGDNTNPTTLSAQNASIEVTGQLIQVREKATLQLGGINQTGATEGGCYLSAPNINNAYGFGSDSVTGGASRSGDLKLYASRINVPGFWAFFKDDNQLVDMVDCHINGWGRVQGKDSRIINTTFEKAHGRYGVLSPKGEIAQLDGVKILDAFTDTAGGTRSAIYFSPTLAGRIVLTNTQISGYDTLVYFESNNDTTPKGVVFRDCEVGQLSGEFKTGAVFMSREFSFNPKIKDKQGAPLIGGAVTITNAQSATVYQGTTNANGGIATIIEVERVTNTGAMPDPNPFSITISDGETEISREFTLDRKADGWHFYLDEPVQDCEPCEPAEPCEPTDQPGLVDLEAMSNAINEMAWQMAVLQQDVELATDILAGTRVLNPETNTLTHYKHKDPTVAAWRFKTYDNEGQPTTASVFLAEQDEL